MSIQKKSNPNLIRLIKSLKNKARLNEAPIWRDVAERLEKSNQNWAEVNLSTIERNAEEDETIVVPGKVLGSGYLTKSLTVGSFKISESARKAIEDEGGKWLSIRELVDENSDGAGIKLMG